MKLRNKVMAGIMCGVMAVSALPVTTFAADTTVATASSKSYKTYSKTIKASGKYYSISNSKIDKDNVSFAVSKKGIVKLKCTKDGKFSVKGLKAGTVTVSVKNKKTKKTIAKYRITVKADTVNMFTDMGEYFEDFSGEFSFGYNMPEMDASINFKGAVDDDKSYIEYTVKEEGVSASLSAFQDDDTVYMSSDIVTLMLISMEINPKAIVENKMVKFTEDDAVKIMELLGEDITASDLELLEEELDNYDISEKTIKEFVTKLETRLTNAGVLTSSKNTMSLVINDGGKKLASALATYVDKDLYSLLKKLDFEGSDEMVKSFKESKSELVKELKALDMQLPKMELSFKKSGRSAVITFEIEELDLKLSMDFNHKSEIKGFDIDNYAPEKSDVITFDKFITATLG